MAFVEGRLSALVTGAGAGLGRDLVIALSQRGLSVVAADIDAAGLAESARLARQAGDVEIHTIAADLTQDGAPERVVAEAAQKFGRLNILINNAGYGGIEPFLEMTAGLWDRTLAINVKALAMLTAAAGRVMRQQRSGRIVNITSPASRMALPNYAAYAASKAAVDSITRTAAIALAPFGVLVNSVAPGMMDTAMQRSTEARLAAVEGRADLQAFLDERTRRVPLGRRAEIDEVAAAILWLALDAPAYITAERLNASGGLDKD
jgi:3-oxoacyl-[acyl-carrier protein] reductase